MEVSVQRLPLSQAEFTISLHGADLVPYFDEAATHLSLKKEIKGFRPGRAPFTVVRDVLGMDAVWAHVLREIVGESLARAVFEHKFETMGKPEVDVVSKTADELVFKAKVDLLPTVDLGEYNDIEVSHKEPTVSDEDVEKTLLEVREMRAKESIKDDTSESGDVVELDMNIYRDGVVMEGGTVKKMKVRLGDPMVMKGFGEHVAGSKKGDHLEFTAKLPDGKDADFKVDVAQIWRIEVPEPSDEFAKSLGAFTSLEDLKSKMRENILLEKKDKEAQRRELEALDAIIEKSTFGEFSPSLISGETDKMIEELRADIEAQGAKFDEYLGHIKKSVEDLRNDMKAGAERRVKMALLIRAIAKKENITVGDSEVEEEINAYLIAKKATPEVAAQVQDPHFVNYIKSMLLSRKVSGFIRAMIDGKKEVA